MNGMTKSRSGSPSDTVRRRDAGTAPGRDEALCRYVRYVFRDFPLDATRTTSNAGLSASMCAGNARFFEAATLLFSTRGSWSSNPAANLAAAMSPMLSQAEVSACLATTDLRNAVLQSRATGLAQFGVSGTPTFIVNGNKVVGNLGLPALEMYFK